MMYYLYANHHWKPSDYTNMGRGEQIVVRAFFLKEVEENKKLERGFSL